MPLPPSLSSTDLLPLAAVALVTLIASATDLWKFKVYNALTLPTLLAGLVASAVLGGWGGLATALMGAGLGFGLLIIFHAVGGVGAGDVKLLAAIGAWLGPYLTYQVFVALALLGGIYAVGVVLLRSGPAGLVVDLASAWRAAHDPASWANPGSTIAAEVRRPDRRRRLVPYAAMTCLGYFATLAWWGSDLDRVWPPYDRVPAAATATAALDREAGR